MELREHGSTAGGDADNGGDPAGRTVPEAAAEVEGPVEGSADPSADPAAAAPADDPVAHDPLADQAEAPDPVEPVEPAGRRYPSTIGGAIFLGVLGTSSFGLAIVTDGNWRFGVKWIAASLLLAAVARLLLPAPQAGMLAVRRRVIDVVLLVIVGLMLWFLSATIPNQPPL